jgi:nicotinate-nucleotide pyrophosphorylase (carboxylating)
MTLTELIRAALKEDMPTGDLTTECLALGPRPGRAKLKAKSDIILAGAAVFEQTIYTLEPGAKLKWHFEEGSRVLAGQIICTLHGDLIQILKAERVSLNFLMHLSGIATYTSLFVEKVKGAHPKKQCKILDTRKTTPGYRELEKRAVVLGGGHNHRQNLSSGVLIKDNHIAVMTGITPAVERARKHTALPLEVEARTLADVQECVNLKIERILLDNMSDQLTAEAMKIIPSSILVEASGNMTLDRVRSVAALGVDFISVGALTHSAPSADLSLQFDWENA